MDPDWPWVCHPRLLAKREDEDEDEVVFHQFPLGRVAQTVAAIIPERFWQMSVGERECEESERDEEEGESGGEETQETQDEEFEEYRGSDEASSSGWTSESSDDSGEEEGDLQSSECIAMIEESVEPADGPLALEDGPLVHTDSSGERGQVGSQEEETRGEEGNGRLDARQLEAAAELATVVEYPVAQLDRATILAAFQRGTGREGYNHVDLWDHY